MYKCKKILLHAPEKFIKYNCSDSYKDVVQVDICIADEITKLWNKEIRTTGCCCGHGSELGFIQVTDECISKMEELGYEHYIYDEEFGGAKRRDAFIPKTYGHIYDGYTKEYFG